MTRSRILLATTLAAACAVFVGTSVYVDFAGLRVRAVKEPISAGPGAVRVPVSPEKLRGLSSPFAVVAQVTNDSADASPIAVRIDDREICAAVAGPGRSTRVDCQFEGPWDPSANHLIALSSGAASWRVDSLELSTHHGSNSSIVRLYVLPASSHQYRTPGAWVRAGLWLLLTVLLLVPPPPMPRALRWVVRIAIGVFVLWAAAVALAPFVSPYRPIVSAGTAAGWLIVCLAPRIYRVARPAVLAAYGWLTAPGPAPKVLAAGGLALVCFAVVTERRVAVEYHGNRSGLLLLSRARINANPWLLERDDVKQKLILLDNNGYDGQFMYAIAFDPFLRSFGHRPRSYQTFIDTPAYRYGRVGYPLLTRILAQGQPERFPDVMIATIYGGVLLAAFGVGWLAWRSGASPWWGLSIALVPGFWTSFRHGLPEPVAAGLVVAGYLCVRDRRFVVGALLLATACLVRETAVFFVVCLGSWLVLSKQPREALKVVGVALGPLCLWRLYVGWVFAPSWGLEAFWIAPDNFGLPFGGIVALWSDLSAGRYYPEFWEMRRSILWFSFLVIAATILSWMMVRARPGAVTAAAAAFGAMAICFNLKNVWVTTGNAERLTCDLFLFLALATPEFISRSRSWRAALIGFWLVVGAYLLFGTLEASFNREALVAVLPW